MKKYIVAAGIVTAAGLAGITGFTVVNAATNNNSTNPMSSLVDALAKKFNLKTSDVQAVFDEQKTAMDAQRTAQMKTQLAQLVSDGKLTQEQADSLSAKRAELEKEREANRAADQNLTETQRRAKMDERKTALDTWLKEKGIDSQYAYVLMGGGRGHGGPGGMRGDKQMQSSATNASPTTTQ